jgi:transposase-like protein
VRAVLFQCAACGHQTSVTAGTIFQDSRTPLTTWFRAMWWLTNQKTGVSALGLQRTLGLRSYKTAWTWLHKLRRAMVRPGRDRLTGRVEVDEAYVGGVHPHRRGRQTETKALVAVAVQVERHRLGRIRLRRIPDASAASLMEFVQDAIEPHSLVHTDGWLGYVPLRRHGYKHRVTFLQGHAPRRSSCHTSIRSCRCSSGGCWARTMAPSLTNISTTTSTSSRFVSTAVAHAAAASCFSASFSRPWR